MSRNSDETSRAGPCRVRTVSVRAVHASMEESEGREPRLVPMAEANESGNRGEAGGNNPFQDFGDGLKKNNNAK